MAQAVGVPPGATVRRPPSAVELELRPSLPPRKRSKIERTPARVLFARRKDAAALRPAAIGTYSRGCLAGGQRLAPTGPAWQAMRLSRNRNWGHPALVRLVERLAVEAKRAGEWPGLLVGDLAQPRGGPMLTGHVSHQIGLDADIWLTPAPDRVLTRRERERMSAISMLRNRLEVNPKRFTRAHFLLIKRAASYPSVDRIGVHRAIKRALCQMETGDKSWLRKISGWRGHHYHMHIRISCPRSSIACRNQRAKRPGDGCADMDRWHARLKAYLERPKPKVKAKPRVRKKRKPRARREIMMSRLPAACRTVLTAGEPTRLR
ncbi:MAG: penicillin-insensitive murein endopeptidase [Pseudomonadota bacterium]